jgi:hypothetical protein
MLRALFGFLNRDLTGRTWEVKASHPYFGDIVLFAFKDTDRSYWEAELECEGNPIGVGINAPDRGEPSESQIQFARRIIAEPDAAFGWAEPLLALEFERWHKKPLPPEWREALKFVGFTVPTDGNEQNEWDLSYESLSDSSGHMFTCYFNGGKPVSVTVDG